ncbi:alpha/beta hydrolase [Actinoalloteichus hymeniacidonis]|uniref:Acyl-CoA:diacylglycerol acyltransferase n=1 Tax=Actinoalloteichus hymeniacidonis TaxID=340345 RepID=A0AAC9HR00_9PSEU|nr:alpha/beta hydrolase-fold protein [Actinoalloteichus hymeniacidonis]AOS63949.1 putative esterase [Actinoalloteichus hymeniacidonis]MBB5907994.1 S-formylglutathione hydrolase FrmB [Actinoalloteichus hymeniacidonis]
MSEHHLSRRGIFKAVGGMTAAMALSGVALGATASTATAQNQDGFGLRVVDGGPVAGRMQYYRFATASIGGWEPAVNILLPDDYHTSGRHYPVLYLLHGGMEDFITFDAHHDIRGLTAGKPIIVVMPDGGRAGWYSNPVSTNVGPRDWEHFHIEQLLRWVDANFRTYDEFDGRAVAGFSMGGFGALKYTAKYWGHFASVSSYSGPGSLRQEGEIITHWANATSATLELGGGSVYGVPLWDQARVSADNPVERVESYRGKRVFMVAGTSPDPVNWFDTVNEVNVLNTQRQFGAALSAAGIPHDRREVGGGHVFRRDVFTEDLNGIIARLRKA